MLKELMKPDLVEALKEHKWGELREIFSEWPAQEIAELLMDLDDKSERVLLFRALPRHISAEIFAYLEPQDQFALLHDLTNQETRVLLENLSPDDRVALLEELPAQVTRNLMALLSPEDLKEVRELLGYPEESVGRLMTPDYVAVHPEWSIEQSLQHIRKFGKDSETINMIYVIDSAGKLLDDFKLRRIILADINQKIEDIMNHSFISLSASEDREVAVEMMKKYDLIALPVVDSDGILLGIVTIDDVLDVAEEETTEDIQKSASIAPLKESYSYASVWKLYRNRVGWLAGLVFVNLLSSGVIAAFENVLSSAIALAFFLPLLIDSGGNTGSQSATLVIRALATGDIELQEWAKIFFKETGVGLLLGISLGFIGLGLGIFRGGLEIGLVVGLAMLFIIIFANLVGMILPFLLSLVRIDPAVASSPLITTIADSTGLLIYFTIATKLLNL